MEKAKALWQLSYAMLIFAGYLLFHRLRDTVWFWIFGIRFRMEQLSRAKLLVCDHCRFYGNPSGGVRLRDLDRCSLVDFRKPRSIQLKAALNRHVERAFNPDRKDHH
jgi:hypothetical protein